MVSLLLPLFLIFLQLIVNLAVRTFFVTAAADVVPLPVAFAVAAVVVGTFFKRLEILPESLSNDS